MRAVAPGGHWVSLSFSLFFLVPPTVFLLQSVCLLFTPLNTSSCFHFSRWLSFICSVIILTGLCDCTVQGDTKGLKISWNGQSCLAIWMALIMMLLMQWHFYFHNSVAVHGFVWVVFSNIAECAIIYELLMWCIITVKHVYNYYCHNSIFFNFWDKSQTRIAVWLSQEQLNKCQVL